MPSGAGAVEPYGLDTRFPAGPVRSPMRRLGVRLLMAAVGVALVAFYASAAYLAYLFLRWAWLGRPDLATTLAVVAGLTVIFGYLSYRFGTARLVGALDAAEIPRGRAPGLYDRVERLSARADVATPRLLVADMEAPNALAVGSPSNGAVVLDRGLFRLLGAAEVEAIIAHEMAHLESHDGLVQTVAYSAVQMVVGLVMVALLPALLLLTGVTRGLAWIRGRPLSVGPVGRLRRWLGHTVAAVLVVLTLVVRAHSRRREFAADDRAVELTGDPLALARALRTIERASTPGGLLAPLYVHGDEEGPLTRLLSTHPPMDERVERLRRQAQERARTRSGARRIPVR